uniref:Uncharacterized protein n=1 Tax=Oryza brachyantha TaxID=4533 RepID=J3MC40_ORYBR
MATSRAEGGVSWSVIICTPKDRVMIKFISQLEDDCSKPTPLDNSANMVWMVKFSE